MNAELERHLQELKDPDARRRRQAARWFQRNPGPARHAVDALVAGLADEDEEVRLRCAGGLAALGPDGAPALMAAARGSDAEPAAAAILALGQAGRAPADALATLVELLDAPDEARRREAAAALHNLGATAVPALVDVLRTGSVRTREAACAVLGGLGDAAVPAIPALVESLVDERHVSAAMAAEALRRIGEPSVAPLAALLEDRTTEVRLRALAALTSIGWAAAAALPPVLERLDENDAALRRAALEVIAATRGDAEAVVPRLARMLRDESLEVRRALAKALARYGRDVPDARAPLKSLIDDTDSMVRAAAVDAVGWLGGYADDTVSRLVELVQDADAAVRRAAARSLGRIGRDADRVVPLLMGLLANADRKVVAAAAEALGGFPAEPATVDALRALLSAPDRAVRFAAIEALERMGEAAAAARPDLEALRGNPDPDFQWRLRRALESIAPSPRAYSMDVGTAGATIDDTGAPPAAPAEFAPAPVAPEAGAAPGVETAPAPAARGPEPVSFTVFSPKEARPGAWYTLLAYAHLPGEFSTVALDSRKRLPAPEFARARTATAVADIPRGAEIAVVPEFEGFTVNPPVQRFDWLEDWHRAEFRLRAVEAAPGRSVNGRVVFYAEGLLAGEVAVSVYVDEQARAEQQAARSISSGKRYHAVFVSYSHRDAAVVDRVTRAAKTLGTQFLRDAEALRSGEAWAPRLLELIEQADAFQLFWSANASASPHVRSEWMHALGLERPEFVRPVYWEEPMPSPPPELAHVHFARYALG